MDDFRKTTCLVERAISVIEVFKLLQPFDEKLTLFFVKSGKGSVCLSCSDGRSFENQDLARHINPGNGRDDA